MITWEGMAPVCLSTIGVGHAVANSPTYDAHHPSKPVANVVM